MLGWSIINLCVHIGIEFGTAGLRGRMAAGFACMNSLIVIQASQGLAKFVRDQRPEIASNGVVIGHDARHNSARFAALAANAFIAQRIPVWFFDEEGPTPMVAFGVNHFRAAAGIMITASHVSRSRKLTCSQHTNRGVYRIHPKITVCFF